MRRTKIRKAHGVPRMVSRSPVNRSPFFHYSIGPHESGDVIAKFVAPISGTVGSLTFFINHYDDVDVDIGLRVSEPSGPTTSTTQKFKTNKVNKMNEDLRVSRGLIFELFIESDNTSVGDIFLSFIFEFTDG